MKMTKLLKDAGWMNKMKICNLIMMIVIKTKKENNADDHDKNEIKEKKRKEK